MEPIIPFEPIRTEDIPIGHSWVGQVKWDGVRVLTYSNENRTQLYNRKLNERTFHYPEVMNTSAYCSARSVILDGEVIALIDGKPSFYEVMRRDGIRNLDNVNFIKKKVSVTYMIFDILYLDGNWVTSYSLEKRQQLLSEVIKPNESIQVVDNFYNTAALYDAVKDQALEGVVYKDLTSSYLINGKDHRWQKKKFYRDVIAVVGGVTLRDNIVNSLLLGLFDHNGQLWYIGHAGTGRLTRNDWRNLTEAVKPFIQLKMPFVNKPPRLQGAIWLKPEITVKVKFAEWIDGQKLRQPSIQAFVSVPASECVFQ